MSDRFVFPLFFRCLKKGLDPVVLINVSLSLFNQAELSVLIIVQRYSPKLRTAQTAKTISWNSMFGHEQQNFSFTMHARDG